MLGDLPRRSGRSLITNTEPIYLPPVEHDPQPRSKRGITAAWVVTVIAAGIISIMTAPGQTAGLSVFTDPLIDELDIDRVAISMSYLIGTLVGAAAQPFIGRASDRWDVRYVIIVIAVAFAAILFTLSFVTDVLGLTFGFVGVRMAGQGALSLAVTTAVSRAIVHRRGLALGISAAIGSAGISLAPIVLERVIDAVGIQATWRWEALAVLVLVIPAALVMMKPTVTLATETSPVPIVTGYTSKQAVRTPMFWVLSAAVGTTSMLGTALAFHQIALLGERGLTPFEAAANFLPQTVTALAATLIVGALIDRIDPRIIMVIAMAAMAASLALVSFVSPGWMALVYGLVFGSAGGMLRGMEAASFARYYGVAAIGAIRGISGSVTLGASALGPIMLAVGADLAGGFALPTLIFAAIPVAVLIAAIVVRPPSEAPPLDLVGATQPSR
jgi:MFS family permease